MAYKFNLKRPSAKESALMVRFSKNGTPFKFYTGKTIKTKNWNDGKQLVKKEEENYDLINKYLESWERELRRIIETMEANQERLNEEVIKERLEKFLKKDQVEVKAGPVNDFITFYDNYIENRSNCSASTLSNFKVNRKHVICCMGLVSKDVLKFYNSLSTKKRGTMELTPSKALPYSQINEDFFQAFMNYLHNAKFTITIRGVEVEQNYKKNYISKHVKDLKGIIKLAFKKGVVPFDLDGFKAGTEEVDNTFTDFNELQSFVNLSLEGREKIVRDRYVLNCFLGMRFSDLKRIKKHLFADRVLNGQSHVVYKGRQVKTGNIVEFPIHRNAINILEEYNYDIPEVSEAEFNKLIKVIAEKAGLTQLFRKRETRGKQETEYNDIPKYLLISSHTGRRSFCTNYYNAGWPIAAIMAVSGHKTEEEFLKYIKAGLKLEIIAEQLSKIPDLNFASVQPPVEPIITELPNLSELVEMQTQILNVA